MRYAGSRTNSRPAFHGYRIVYIGETRHADFVEGGDDEASGVGLDAGLLRVMSILFIDLFSYKATLADALTR